jgi:hypothetical protein
VVGDDTSFGKDGPAADLASHGVSRLGRLFSRKFHLALRFVDLEVNKGLFVGRATLLRRQAEEVAG